MRSHSLTCCTAREQRANVKQRQRFALFQITTFASAVVTQPQQLHANHISSVKARDLPAGSPSTPHCSPPPTWRLYLREGRQGLAVPRLVDHAPETSSES